MSQDRALRVFVKAPRPGEVKSRLAKRIGAERAARVYRALAEAEIAATEPRPVGDFERTLCFAPRDARGEIETWLPGRSLEAQQGADLGGRMLHAFDRAFAEDTRRVALIGTDVPWVTRDHVLASFRALDDADVVLGPSSDGGYYLIALRRSQARLFEGIPWSTPEVLPRTLRRAADLGLRVRVLEELPDVDTFEDVQALWSRLKPILRPFAGRPLPPPPA